MHRRRFLAAAATLSLLATAPASAAPAKKKPARAPARKPGSKAAAKPATPSPANHADAGSGHTAEPVSEPASEIVEPWRHYTLTTRFTAPLQDAPLTLWMPLPLSRESNWQLVENQFWSGNAARAGIRRDLASGTEAFHAEWLPGATPELEFASVVRVRNRHFDVTRRANYVEHTDVLRRFLRSSERVSTDGRVRERAQQIVGRIKDPLAKGKAIYDWVVDHCLLDTTQPFAEDIASLLAQSSPSGNADDLALAFVALCRATGLPARPVFGLRVDTSELMPALGVSSGGTARHCRAEFFAPGYGWIPVDPVDVLRASPGTGSLGANGRLALLRKLLFGFWEMNWLALNQAADSSLFDQVEKPLPAFNELLLQHGGTVLQPLRTLPPGSGVTLRQWAERTPATANGGST